MNFLNLLNLLNFLNLLNLLFYRDPDSFRVSGKLRRVHTLDTGDAIAEFTGMGGKEFVFEYVGSFPQVTEEEIGTRVFGAFVIT